MIPLEWEQIARDKGLLVDSKPIAVTVDEPAPPSARRKRKVAEFVKLDACMSATPADRSRCRDWLELTLPIEVKALGNKRGFSADVGHTGRQRWQMVRMISPFWRYLCPFGDFCRMAHLAAHQFPGCQDAIRVTFTRIGGRRMDEFANLPRSFKHLEDSLAAFLGCDDGWPQWIAKAEQTESELIGCKIRLERR